MQKTTSVEEESRVLGCDLGGHPVKVRRDIRKLCRVKQAFEWRETGPIVSGNDVEVLLGHYIAASLFQRGGMSVPRAVCMFVRDRYWEPTRLWDMCRFESWVISGTCLLLVMRLDLGFPPVVAATDASMSGVGECQAAWPEEAIRDAAKWQEKWGFRRLAPTEWAPRRRALNELHEITELHSPGGFP